MLPVALVDRFDILTVPLTIVIDGEARPEDEVDLGQFYDALRSGAPISTAAPSPGEVLAVYERASAHGAEAILSVHVGSNRSATVDSARIAAAAAGVPVTIVDTGTASFIEGCCVWRAAERLRASAGLDDAAAAARQVAKTVSSVFTVGDLTRAGQGGRLAVAEGDGIPVFSSSGPDMEEVAKVTSAGAAIELMVGLVAGADGPLRVGVGDADAGDAVRDLESTLRGLPQVAEIIRYTVGPSVATHTGAGTFGAVFHRL